MPCPAPFRRRHRLQSPRRRGRPMHARDTHPTLRRRALTATLGVLTAMLAASPRIASAAPNVSGRALTPSRMMLSQAPTGLQAAVQSELTASDGTPGDAFGWSVAISGSTALVGASGKSPNGAAYEFVRSGATW